MGVTPRAQGRGVGRQLLAAAIDWFRESDQQVLFLESHRSLKAALRLYESAGFRHCERPEPPMHQSMNSRIDHSQLAK